MALVFVENSNLFWTDMQTIAITVNLVGAMGKGIAKRAALQWPFVLPLYRNDIATKQLDKGRLRVYDITAYRKMLAFPTKYDWRDDSDKGLIEANLQALRDTYRDLGITSLALPMLGCGNGNLDWKEIRPLIQRYLGDLPINIEVYGPEV